ncbi:MAG TPA: integrin alpha, partial [Sumerlaeia bacterium]|nr:integrin alpha [Sumerlaeia bacterium]
MFGSHVCGIPDITGDGLGDLVVGRVGILDILDGADGGPLRSVVAPNPGSSGSFGYRFCTVPDLTGDGRWDIIVGAHEADLGPSLEDAGRAYVISAATGEFLQTLTSPEACTNGHFGIAVSGVADLSGDGRGDLIVSATGESGGAGPQGSGRVFVFDGATGALLHTLASPHEQERGCFGSSVSGIPDVNGDGKGDIAVGASYERLASGYDEGGCVYVFDGATGALLWARASPNPQAKGRFGTALAGLSDVDGDGRGDLAVGAHYEDSGVGAQDVGRVYVLNGSTGVLIAALASPNEQSSGYFGISLSSVPDADGNSFGDMVVGAIHEEPANSPDGAGRAYIFYLGPETITTLIESFYHLVLGRAPEDGAVDAWKTGYFDYAVAMNVDVRFAPREMGRLFFLSDEYASRSRTNEQFITNCYWA